MISGLSLLEIEEVLKERLFECEIVSDIKLSYEDFIYLENKFKEVFENANQIFILGDCIEKFKVSVTVLLVYEAIYRYKNFYWDNILALINREIFSEGEVKEYFASVFRKTIKNYNMKNFADVGGYKNVTPIICHSGIPNSSLSTLFEITNQFMNEADAAPEDIIENIKYFIRYKVDKSIYRFITTNEDRAKEFIYDLQMLIKDVESYDYSYEDAINKFSFIDKRILDEYFLYRKTISDTATFKNKRKKYLVQPKLILNRFTESLSVKLPTNIIKNGYDDIAEWIITTDDNEEIIKCSIYEEKIEFITEEKTVSLLPSEKYEIKLMYEGDMLGKWEYLGLSDEMPFLLFDSNYNLIKSNIVSDENIYILLKNKYYIDEKEINCRNFTIGQKGWIGVKGYEVNFKEKIKDIKIYKDEKSIAIIQYRNKNNIKLVGRSEIFKASLIDSYVPIFSEIPPRITIDNVINIDSTYYMTIRNLKHDVNLKVPMVAESIENELVIPLEGIDCFENKIYGEYDIRIYSGKRLVKILPFKLVPYIKVSNLNWEIYPSEKGVYKKQSFKLICDNLVKVNFDELDGDIVSKEIESEYYFNNFATNHFITGTIEMIFNDKYYNFSIRKKSRNICYGILNEGEESLILKKEPIKLFLKELESNNKTLALSFMDEYSDNFKVKCILEDNKGNELQVSNSVGINNKIMYIALNKFYDTISKSLSNRFNIRVIIKNKNDVELCNFTPCIIKEEVLISKVKYNEMNNQNIMLSWTGEGLNIDNELVLKIYDLLQPWKDPMNININTNSLMVNKNRFTLYLNKEDYSLENGTIYYFNIEEYNEDFFEDLDINNKVLIFKEDGLYPLKVDSSINKCEDIKTLISYVIKTVKKGDLEVLLNIIKSTKTSGVVDEDIVKGLYFLHANDKSFLSLDKAESILKYNCIYTLCKKYFDKCNIYLILDILLSYDKYENIKKLLNIINIFNLDIDVETNINKDNRDKLWKEDKERGFLIETRSGISSKSILISNIFELVGDDLENKILGYSKDCDACKYKGNKGCVSQFIKRRCNKRKVNLTEELIGSSKLYQILFEKYDTKLNQKDLEGLGWINDVSEDGIVVLGDTYVKTILKWVLNNNLEYREKINSEISDKLEILNRLIKKLTMNNEFVGMHSYLIKRKESNKKSPNTLAYYSGVTVLISSMIKYKMLEGLVTNIERQIILKLLLIFRKNMYEIYLRDLIIIEFYLMQGEELYVDGSN